MRTLATVICTTAVLAAGCGGDDDEDAVSAGPLACGDVGFEPNTDAGAFDVSAAGVDCDTALDVAAASEGVDATTYEAAGFECTGRPGGGELPTVEWTCTREGSRVTFSTS